MQKINSYLYILILSMFFCYDGVTATVKYPFPSETRIQLKNNLNRTYYEASVRIVNPSEQVWLIQSWGEDIDNMPYQISFPSLQRLEPRSSVALKIYLKNDSNEEKMPDRLLIKLIPSTSKMSTNRITIPLIYQLKIVMSGDENI